jgi:tetratricopeptide (TPR) repeat protein
MKKSLLFLLVLSCIHLAKAQTPALLEAFTLSYTQEYAGDYTSAISTLKKEYDEKGYEVNLRLGYLHYMAGLFTESITYYQKAMNLMPMSIEAKLGFVLPASALGNWTQVENQYKKILEIDPSHAQTNYRLGLILYGKKDYQTAYRYFEKVVNQYPFGYDALLMYAWTNLQLGKYREAKVLFNKVLLYSPGDVSALEGLGLIK